MHVQRLQTMGAAEAGRAAALLAALVLDACNGAAAEPVDGLLAVVKSCAPLAEAVLDGVQVRGCFVRFALFARCSSVQLRHEK